MFTKKIAVLFSGEGSNLENLIKKFHGKKIENAKYEIVVAVCNNKNAKGLERAQKYGVKTVLLEHTKYNSREEFDAKLVEIISSFDPDITVLAGFMRILTPIFTQNIKAINLHPSLLPLFKGANAIEKSFYSDMKVGGVSVHFVSSELDGGEIIAQKCFQKDDMDIQEYKQKIKEIEFELLPQAILKVLKD